MGRLYSLTVVASLLILKLYARRDMVATSETSDDPSKRNETEESKQNGVEESTQNGFQLTNISASTYPEPWQLLSTAYEQVSETCIYILATLKQEPWSCSRTLRCRA